MNPSTQGAGLPFAPVQHQLTAYDTPQKPGTSPQAKARQAAKDEVSHPFIHYLAQFVPGLVSHAPPGPSELLALQAAQGDHKLAGELLKSFENGLSTQGQPTGQPGRMLSPEQLALAQAFITPSTLPPQSLPVEPAPPADSHPLSPVPPPAIPSVVLASVQRMQAADLQMTQLRVQLDPPHLGKLDLAFTYAQQKVSVNVMAASQQAKDHLDGQLGAIRDILTSHNLQTGELKVVLGGQTGGQPGGQGNQNGSGDRGGSGTGAALQQPLRRRRRVNLDEDPMAESI